MDLHVLDEVHDLGNRVVLRFVRIVSEARIQTQGCLDSNLHAGLRKV